MKKILFATLAASVMSLSANAFTHQFTLKGRGGLAQIDSSIKTGNKGTKSNQKTKDGWLGELALGYLLTQNVAFEVSAGYGSFSTQNATGKKKSSLFVPITGTVMFRLPMYDRFFPYVGAGYGYRILSTSLNNTKIANSSGMVLQAGTDIFFDGTNQSSPVGFNIDLKYYLKTKNQISETSFGAVEKFSNNMSEMTILGGVVVPF